MKIKILSDSTCDLSKELLEKYNVDLYPLTVVKDGEQFKDNITITPADIFAHVAAGGGLCSTAAISVGEYQDFFQKYASEYDAVIHINIGSGFSSCYQNACLAAEEFNNVYPFDSMTLSTGQGFIVIEACRLAQQELSAAQILEKLREYSEKIEISFLLDKLEYMVKGGRCSAATALGANLLNLKPCIEVKAGKLVVVKKYRGNHAKCLINYVKDRLDNRDDIRRDTLIVTCTPVTEECYQGVMNAVSEYGHFENVYETVAGCTVSCHCGPSTLGVIFVRK